MNKLYLLFTLIFLSSCQAIANIFKAGAWTGFVIAGIFALVVILLFARKKQ